MASSTWGLALNGSRARIVRDLENRRDEEGLPEELGVEMKPQHLRDIMADKPGRAMSSHGTARSAMEYSSDPVEDEKRAFCDEVISLLSEHLGTGFDRLVVAASPEMLGILRDRRGDTLEKATVCEMDKDLLNHDRKSLRHSFQDMMPSRIA